MHDDSFFILYCGTSRFGISCYTLEHVPPDRQLTEGDDGWMRLYTDDDEKLYSSLFSYQSYSRKAGRLLVSDARPNAYYFQLSNITNVNYQSLCRKNIQDRFLVYDSSKVRILSDKCMEETKNSSVILYQYSLSGPLMYIDYSNTTNEYNDASPIKNCYGARNYVLIIKFLNINNNTKFDAGGGIQRLTCENAIISVRSKHTYYVYGSDDDQYGDHNHLIFNSFSPQQNYENSTTKYTGISTTSVPSDTNRTVDLRYCYVEDGRVNKRLAKEFINSDQFSIRADNRVIIQDVSSLVYFGFISTFVNHDIYVLHCFIALV